MEGWVNPTGWNILHGRAASMGQVQASYRAAAGYHDGDLRQDSLYNVILAYWRETATRQKA
jgi:hypothetical protein